MIPAAVLVVLVGCGGSSGNNNGNPDAGGNNNNNNSGSVTGVVTDIGTSAPISGAAVSGGGGASATTDARGAFTLTGLASGPVVLSISKNGYAPGYANGTVGANAESVLVRLKAEGTPQTYSTSTAKTLSVTTENGPYAVILPANSVDTTDANITVSVTPLDPTTEAGALPGSLVASNSSVLLPVTFAEFTLRDSTGKRLNLKSSASATVELPIPAALRSAYPLGSKIHCYSYDSTTGKWADFVDGTVQVSSVDGTSPVLAASIRHFSWYGGAPEGNDCVDVYVKVTSAVDGKPLGNARVEATPGTVAYTDANGVASVRSAVGPTASEFTAYQTGIDVDGSLTGIAGAKYIEFGRVDVELVGLVTKACSEPAAGGQPSGTGSSGSPIAIPIGVVKGVYQAFAVLGTSGGQGSLTVELVQGVPGPGGELENPVPADGAKIFVSATGGTPVMLTSAGQGTGVYYSPSTFAITAGQTYTLTIDGDGNGSIDGSGSAAALGDVAFTNPTEGGNVNSSDFVASWSDSAAGAPGYVPYYEVLISGTGTDFAFYVGTDRQWTVTSSVTQGAPLDPGDYQASLIGFAGAFTGGQGGIAVTNNITGVGVTGQFFSVSNEATPVSFTVH